MKEIKVRELDGSFIISTGSHIWEMSEVEAETLYQSLHKVLYPEERPYDELERDNFKLRSEMAEMQLTIQRFNEKLQKTNKRTAPTALIKNTHRKGNTENGNRQYSRYGRSGVYGVG